jgi:tripartite-type tricarboxylate transporter receptor subunit TctC
MKRRSALLGTVALTAVALTACMMTPAAWGQAGYPERPIRVILPYAAGVSPDIVARLLAERLTPALGRPVIIDNRPGAGGMIGAEVAATLPPDGYNLLFTVKGVMAIVPHVYPSAKFNSLKDFKAVAEILQVPHIIVATNKAPYSNMKELVEYAKKNPGKINYASNGTGSHPHVGMETIANRLGIQIVHVPYKTVPGPDVIAGVVELFLEASTTAIPNIKAGKIKALATSGPERIPALPDLPTLTEFRADLDPNGATGNSWHGIFAPAGTPDPIINRLNTEIVKVVKLPEVQQRLREYGLTPTGTSAEHLQKELAANYAYWGQIVKQLNVKVD